MLSPFPLPRGESTRALGFRTMLKFPDFVAIFSLGRDP